MFFLLSHPSSLSRIRISWLLAITVTMPIGATLALWIVYAANNGDPQTMVDFSRGMMFAIIPTEGFLVVNWLASRAGLKLLPILLMGYAVWGFGVGLIFIVKRTLGV
jgi:hypothetical protein